MNELRPCIVKIPENVSYKKTGFLHKKYERTVFKKAETHNAFFHTWITKKFVSNNYLYAVVEYEDGTIHEIESDYITFTDR